MMTNHIETPVRNLATIKQFVEKHQAFTAGGIRWQIFNEATYGLVAAGVVLRCGRKVLIDETRYFDWLVGMNKRPAK